MKKLKHLSCVVCIVALCSCGQMAAEIEEEAASNEATEGCDPQLVNVELRSAVDEVRADPNAGPALEQKLLSAREAALSSQIREISCLQPCDGYCYSITEAFLTHQLGRCEMFSGKYPAAIDNLKAAVEMAKSMNYRSFVYACYLSLAMCYEKAGLTKEAQEAKLSSQEYKK